MEMAFVSFSRFPTFLKGTTQPEGAGEGLCGNEGKRGSEPFSPSNFEVRATAPSTTPLSMLAFSFALLLPIFAVAKPSNPPAIQLVTERYLLQRQDSCSSCTQFTTGIQNCVSSDPSGAQPSTVACICSSEVLSPIQPCYSCLSSEGTAVPDALQTSVDQLTLTCRAAGYEVPDITLEGSVASSSAVAQGSSSAALSASAASSSSAIPRVSPSVRTTSIPASASATGSTGAGEKRVKEGGVAMLLGAAAVAFWMELL
ncbi:hypothetical protein BDY24DRAFT_439697 [Mrakia frigida]|uniref:uncharacterized protein n=1 Tax=Mrakia frigida TaxID=29902 RepID=UPI003FCBF997